MGEGMIEVVVDGEPHRVEYTSSAPRKVVLTCECGLKACSITLKTATAKLVRWHLKFG